MTLFMSFVFSIKGDERYTFGLFGVELKSEGLPLLLC